MDAQELLQEAAFADLEFGASVAAGAREDPSQLRARAALDSWAAACRRNSAILKDSRWPIASSIKS